MTESNQEIVKQLQQVGRYMMDKQLAWGNAGNISARAGKDHCLISASGTYLGELETDDIVDYTFGDDMSNYQRRPSKEIPMHQAIYEERPDVQAVLHASPFYSTIVACSDIQLPANLFVEDMYYLESVVRIPYFHPGSQELGDAVRSKARQANILLLENHGVLVFDTSIKEARMALETLELVSKMMVSAPSVDFKPLSDATVHEFLNDSGYKARRKWEKP
ncbi:L-fuculose-phosphate aldolase [Pullulanibacillus pueri]|uniref:Class II aldolase n=1 Tax=Pullulanibacillus pueri TaxID=1437324 RepID=A0A8J2ZXA0_9BACL|nr:class II aldolase/adducin family protein [Pullulanibacillus pueri]MBM7682913.1 L-fuculose-phosphate aldolase [Pullulanibacillus pueri]GGH84806.1 class II aldolase [Pullulanibacillus pueri]